MRLITLVVFLAIFNCAAPGAEVKKRATSSNPPPPAAVTSQDVYDVRAAINPVTVDELLKFAKEIHTVLEREEGGQGSRMLVEINSIGAPAVDCCNAAGRFLKKALGKEILRRGTKVVVEARWEDNFYSHEAWYNSFFSPPSWALTRKDHYLVTLQMTDRGLEIDGINYNREIIASVILPQELTAGWCIRRPKPICRESCTTNRISAGIGARVRVETAIAEMMAKQKKQTGGLTESANSVTLGRSGLDEVSATSIWSGSGVPWHEVSEEQFAGVDPEAPVCMRICGLPVEE